MRQLRKMENHKNSPRLEPVPGLASPKTGESRAFRNGGIDES
jgi:hypothetical protein